jgi:hypothetical protein
MFLLNVNYFYSNFLIMVKILSNGDIVADDDPRAQQSSSRSSGSKIQTCLGLADEPLDLDELCCALGSSSATISPLLRILTMIKKLL